MTFLNEGGLIHRRSKYRTVLFLVWLILRERAVLHLHYRQVEGLAHCWTTQVAVWVYHFFLVQPLQLHHLRLQLKVALQQLNLLLVVPRLLLQVVQLLLLIDTAGGGGTQRLVVGEGRWSSATVSVHFGVLFFLLDYVRTVLTEVKSCLVAV